MTTNRVLTIQDISCFGQCSITVALPVLSVLGLETVILPSAILSTHTSGFKDYVFNDFTEQMSLVLDHWRKENIKFNALYSGYLGKAVHIDLLKKIAFSEKKLFEDDFKFILDPVMADGGKLYPTFDQAYVEKMKTLVFGSDIILPNVSEACFLADIDYVENYDKVFIDSLLDKLQNLGAKVIVLTGVSFDECTIGVFVLTSDYRRYYRHKRFNFNLHGTGDLFSSAFVGMFLKGFSIFESVQSSADFVVHCMEAMNSDLEEHWWGVEFERELFWLMDRIREMEKKSVLK